MMMKYNNRIEMYDSQRKSNFNQFHQRWQPYHSNCDLYSLGKGCLFEKKENHDAILRRWCSCCLACSWPIYDVTHDRQVYQVCQHDKTYDLRESALRLSSKKSCEFRSKSGHVEKLVCDDTAAARLYNFARRSCGNHMKPVDFSPQNFYHTTDVW